MGPGVPISRDTTLPNSRGAMVIVQLHTGGVTDQPSAHTHCRPLHLSVKRLLCLFLFSTLGGVFFPFTGPKCWCLAASCSASLTFRMLQKPHTTSIHISTQDPSQVLNQSLGFLAVFQAHAFNHFLPISQLDVYHQTWGLPHRAYSFPGLPSSEKSSAMPPTRQARNSGVILNTTSSPAPLPSTVHQD